MRELMLPLLIYPMTIPALMGAMQLSTVLISGQPLTAEHEMWFRLLIGFDAIYTVLALVLMETVLVS
jgi:heme exporter protein B